jgi:NAD(P)H-dependent FMN reductase
MHIEIISGSPRKNSLTNRVALHLQKTLAEKSDHEIGLIDLRDHVLPPMDTVFSSVGKTPEAYKSLAERMFAADAFIIVTPEYNGSYSPAMKNLFDHFPKQQHKAFGIVTASPGAMGGIRAAMQLQQTVLALFGNPSPHMLIVPLVDQKFDADGFLMDNSFQPALNNFMEEFLWLGERISNLELLEQQSTVNRKL